MSEAKVDSGRRTWIAITCGAGAVGGAAVAVPFVASFAPSERAKAAGAPVQADIGALRPGEKMTVEWRGKPVWIVRRTPEQVAELPKLDDQLADPFSKRNPAELTPEYARNVPRSIKPEFLVTVGICTHLAGRVFKNKPAPDNLEVPPHRYLSDTLLLIGEDKA